MHSDNMKTLVIDDEVIIRERLVKLLELEGYEAWGAENGPQGMKIFEDKSPDVVITDVKMPVMDGIAVLKAIKDKSPRTAVILITGHGDLSTTIEALRMGAFDYHSKPIDFDKLAISIKRALDIQRIERNLAESRSYTENILKSMIDTLVTVDLQWTITAVNQATLELLGYKQDELVGQPISRIIFEIEQFKSKLNEFQMDVQQTSGTGGLVKDLELHYLTKSQDKIPVSLSSASLKDSAEKIKGMVFVARDMRERLRSLAEREQLQQQLFQSSKLATVGTLAAGIAHELNNPLTIVVGYAQKFKSEIDKAPAAITPELEEKAKYLNMICKAAERMKKIVSNLLIYARENPEHNWQDVAINSAINDSLAFFSNEFERSGISISLKLADGLPAVWGDSNRIESVFQNLLSNSRDAFTNIRDGRKKSITVSSSVNETGDVTVIYQDNAGGMPKEVQDRMFDPFFTTKDIGKGTGLGMSICLGIIEMHKGKITVESKPGDGTKFAVILPQKRQA